MKATSDTRYEQHSRLKGQIQEATADVNRLRGPAIAAQKALTEAQSRLSSLQEQAREQRLAALAGLLAGPDGDKLIDALAPEHRSDRCNDVNPDDPGSCPRCAFRYARRHGVFDDADADYFVEIQHP